MMDGGLGAPVRAVVVGARTKCARRREVDSIDASSSLSSTSWG